MASGKIILFLDDDTVVDKNWLTIISVMHKKYPKIEAIAGSVIPYKNDIISEFSKSLEDTHTPFQIISKPVLVNNVSYKRESINNIRFHNSELNSEDVDFNYDFLKKGGKCIYIPQIIVKHKYRDSIKGLFLQQMFMGKQRIGTMIEQNDYPFDRSNMLICVIKRIVTPLFDPWLRFRYAVLNHKRCPLSYLGLGYIQQIAYTCGFFKGIILRIKNRIKNKQ